MRLFYKLCFFALMCNFAACTGSKKSSNEPAGNPTGTETPAPPCEEPNHMVDGKCMTHDEKRQHECASEGKHFLPEHEHCITAEHFECLKTDAKTWHHEKCVDVASLPHKVCEKEGGEWKNNVCHPTTESCAKHPTHKVFANGKCMTGAEECGLRDATQGWEWHKAQNRCWSLSDREIACGTKVDHTWDKATNTCKDTSPCESRVTESHCGSTDATAGDPGSHCLWLTTACYTRSVAEAEILGCSAGGMFTYYYYFDLQGATDPQDVAKRCAPTSNNCNQLATVPILRTHIKHLPYVEPFKYCPKGKMKKAP